MDFAEFDCSVGRKAYSLLHFEICQTAVHWHKITFALLQPIANIATTYFQQLQFGYLGLRCTAEKTSKIVDLIYVSIDKMHLYIDYIEHKSIS
jgi:hypothetical protein